MPGGGQQFQEDLKKQIEQIKALQSAATAGGGEVASNLNPIHQFWTPEMALEKVRASMTGGPGEYLRAQQLTVDSPEVQAVLQKQNTHALRYRDDPAYKKQWDDSRGGGLESMVKAPLSHLEQTLDTWKDNPEQALLGMNTEFETDLWNQILGTDYQPVVTNTGGATDAQLQQMQAEGIASAGAGYDVADTTAMMYGMSTLNQPGAPSAPGSPPTSPPPPGAPATAALNPGNTMYGPGAFPGQGGFNFPGAGVPVTGGNAPPNPSNTMYGPDAFPGQGGFDFANAAPAAAAPAANNGGPSVNNTNANSFDPGGYADLIGATAPLITGGGGGGETKVPKWIDARLQQVLNRADQIYLNERGTPVDPNNYMDTTLQNLVAMQSPQQNPYLDTMLGKSNEAIADQVFSSYGRSGRGPGVIDPASGQVSDTAVNFIDQIGDNTRQFLGNQYQSDMNRAMQAITTGATTMPGALQFQQDQPWMNIKDYSDIVGAMTGIAPTRNAGAPDASGWERLLGLAGLGYGLYNAGRQ